MEITYQGWEGDAHDRKLGGGRRISRSYRSIDTTDTKKKTGGAWGTKTGGKEAGKVKEEKKMQGEGV